MRIFLLIFCTFSVLFSVKAQDKQFIKIDNQLNSFAVSQDESFMVFVAKNKMYKADVQTMKVLDSFAIPISEENYISNIRISPNNNVVLLKQHPYKEKRWMTYDFLEYPQDSIHIFSLTDKKVTGSVSGNFYFEYLENQTDNTFLAINDYFSYIDQNDGSTLYSPQKGFLLTYPSEKKTESPGIVRAICKHPQKNEIAIAYYNYQSQTKDYQYVLEIRNTETLEVIRSKEFSGAIKKITPSKDGKIWQIIIEEKINEFKTIMIDYESLEEITAFDKTTKFSGWITNGKVFNQINDYDIHIYDVETFEQIEEVWALLTPFPSIFGFYALNATELLIFGNNRYNATNKYTGVQKFSLKQEEIFTKKSTIEENTKWFEPDVAFLSTNTFKEKYDKIEFYSDWILVHNESSVEFWNITQQKKWRTLQFSKKIDVHFSEKTMKLLVFEEAEGKNYSDFVLREIDLNKGESHSKLYLNNPYPFLNSSCDCEPIPDSSDWICADLGGLWKINATDLSIYLIQSYTEEKSPDQILFADQNKILLKMAKKGEKGKGWGSSKEENLGYFWLDTNTKTDSKIESSEQWEDVHYSENGTFLFTKDNGFFLQKQNSIKQIATLSKDFRNILLSDSGIWFEQNRTLKHIDLNGKISDTNFDKVIRHNGYGTASENPVFITTENIYTYHKKENYFDTWRTSNVANILYPNTDILYNPKGFFLWKNSLLLDVNSLSSEQKYEVYSGAYLFEKTPYVVYKEHYAPTNTFHLYVETLEQNPKEIWKSPALEDTYFDPKKYVFSDSEEQFIGFVEGVYSTVYNKFYWADWKKNKFNIINCKTEISFIVKTYNPEIVEVFYKGENKKSDFFNIVTGEWNKNFIKQNTPNTKPQIHFDIITYNNKNYYAREYIKSAHFSDEHRKIIAGSENGKLFVWNTDNSSPFKVITTGATQAILRIIETEDKFVLLDTDGFIHFIDTKSLEWTASVATQAHDKKYSALWYTPQGFYSANKTTLRDFHFIKQNKMMPLTTFDAYLNRPEKILEKLTKPNNQLLKLYQEATAKRMRRLGISENTDFWNLERPNIAFLEGYSPNPITKETQIEIPIKFSKSSEILEIYDNGILIESKKISNSDKYTSLIKLHSGENNINISVTDKNKIQSEPLSFKITNTEIVEPKVYYIGIGVSEYQDTTMNLKFAVKDVEKIEEFFKWRYRDKIEIHKLINQEVTVDNIKKLKQILEKTDVNDKVIISFSGHGLINSQKEFYFAGYHTDFSAPEKQGIPFELIQSLTENIPARKRLILLDACHSGSIDEEDDIEVTNHKDVKEHNIKGSIVIKGKKEPLESFEQMQNMFFDLNRTDGTIIIAASGAKEYAYEGDDWSNGVFTYSFIKSVEELGYDTWRGKIEVPVSELQKAIYQKVTNFTKGKQKPTSRSENLEWDWKL